MKHARADYARIQDPDGIIPDDEPVFLLRGQDRRAVRAVVEYALDVFENSSDFTIAALALRQAAAMVVWQRDVISKEPDV